MLFELEIVLEKQSWLISLVFGWLRFLYPAGG